ncbi:hypothetical protein DFH09DRAFT_1081500 [Mycena vulgaris]|nr:hypothetical protein DFH09DRAFT_1081500 [Mycena vulgaris]
MSSTSGVPTGTPRFINIISPADMITCAPATISWEAQLPVGAKMNLTLLRVQTIAEGLDPSSGTYTWASVNVTAGVYSLQASTPLPGGIVEDWGTSVTVVNGTNTSCLAPTVHSSASSGTSSPRPPATLTITPHTSTAPPTASNPTNKRASKTSPGIIAGAVVGALALIAAAFTCVPLRITAPIPTPLRHPSVAGRGSPTTIALDRPVAPGVVESQEAMLLKSAGLLRRRRDEESASSSQAQSHVDVHQVGLGAEPGQAEVAQQLREMAERMALIEVQIRMNDPPPGYTQGPAS